jgi:ribosomal protein L40E
VVAVLAPMASGSVPCLKCAAPVPIDATTTSLPCGRCGATALRGRASAALTLAAGARDSDPDCHRDEGEEPHAPLRVLIVILVISSAYF